MIINFVFRLALTITIFIYLKIQNVQSLPLLVALLFIFDAVDCGRLSPFDADCKSYDYQIKDKIVDMFAYILFFTLFKNLFDDFTKKILFVFILYRVIGVIGFVLTKNTFYLKIFPDFVNSTLIAYIIYQYFNLERSTYYILIVVGMIFKIFFEQYLHGNTYH